MYQQLTIAGNLGRDPEMRYLPSGTAVTNINVATNRVYYKDEEKITETTWFRVSLWGKRAENVNQYLSKGSKVLVTGYLKPEIETFTRKDGTVGASYEVTAQNITFLSSRGEDHGYNSEEDFPEPQQAEVPW